ncbi:MAG: hypothetical protein ACOYL7_06530 [Caldilinea sp.]
MKQQVGAHHHNRWRDYNRNREQSRRRAQILRRQVRGERVG